jgi:hypothetical protein
MAKPSRICRPNYILTQVLKIPGLPKTLRLFISRLLPLITSQLPGILKRFKEATDANDGGHSK